MKAVLVAACFVFCGIAWSTPSTAGEREERNTIYEDAKEAFLAGRFDRLDATAQAYRETRAKTESGQAKLGFFYKVLGSAAWLYGAADAAAINMMDAQVAAWIRAAPRSRSANIMSAKVLIARAWLARGPGFANTVSRDQWRDMYALAARASRKLEDSRSFASDDPEWHATYLEIAKITTWPSASFKSVADEGLTVDPTYFPVHAAILENAMPKWGGSWAAIDAAADDFVTRTSGELGQTLYARSYQWLSSIQLRRRLFEKSLAKWPRMKQGFEDLIARYPSDWNLNTFGIYACFARDWDTLRSILARLGDRIDDELWYQKSTREWCMQLLDQPRREAEDAEYYKKPIPVAEELSERLKIEQEATTALLEGRFDEIETVRARLLSSKETTTSGSWKLVWYTEGLSPYRLLAGGSIEVSQRIRGQIAYWRASKPNSVGAAVAAARLALIDGRIVRNLQSKPAEIGQGVSEVAKFLAQARRDLELSRVAGERDPVWWSTFLFLNDEDLVSDEVFYASAAQALSVEPDYGEMRAIIFGRAKLKTNEFWKTHQRALAFVLYALPSDRADEVYAAANLGIGDQWPGDDIVEVMNIDWPRMRRGLEAIVARWPSDWNLTAYARFACMAKDKPTASALMSRVGDRLVWSRWTNWRGHDQCRSWAQAAQ